SSSAGRRSARVDPAPEGIAGSGLLGSHGEEMAQETKSSQQAQGTAGRVERVAALLKTRLEDEAMVLDVLLGEVTKGRSHPELWTQLHEAAVRDDMLPELAFAYEQMARGKKLKGATAAAQAE